MYFCYVDESGDCGYYNAQRPEQSGSKHFIITGIIVAENRWKLTLDSLKAFRKRIAREAYLPYHVEFHCAELIDPHKVKAFTQINVAERWMLVRSYAEVIGKNDSVSIISVVINKEESLLEPYQYLTAAIGELYKAFDDFLKTKEQNGLIFFDRANEKHINTYVRRLLGTGASGEPVPDIRISRIIEDPVFRVSTDSMFIQAADVVAYSLKEFAFPKGARKKFNADNIFSTMLSGRCLKTSAGNEMGIIYI